MDWRDGGRWVAGALPVALGRRPAALLARAVAGGFGGHDPVAAPVDVLHVAFVSGTGGASTLLRELSARLIAHGLSVRLVVPAWDTTAPFAERCRARGIPVERTPWLIAHGSPERLYRTRSFVEAVRLLQRYPARVVHFHLGGDSAVPARFLAAAELIGLPRVFVTPHNNADDPPPGDPRARRWAAQASRTVAKVLAISQEGRRRQLAYGVPAERVTVVPVGVDVARFACGDARAVWHALGLRDADVPLVLYCARVSPEKRPLDALHAFARVAPHFPRAHFAVVGDGPLREAMRERAVALGLGGRVHVVGARTNVPDWLAAASVYVLPTESEGFSVGVLEALAAGCPIVSTQCSGIDEVLIDEENALLGPVGDADAMAVALGRMLSDPALRARLAAAGRRTVRRYTLEHMVAEHLALYGPYLAGARPPHARGDVEVVGSRPVLGDR